MREILAKIGWLSHIWFVFYVKLILFNIFFFKSVEFENNASDIMNPSIVTNTDIAKNSI